MTRAPIPMSMTRPGTAPSQRKRSFTAIWSPGRSGILVIKKLVLDMVESILKEPVYLLMRQIRLSQKMLLRKRKH